MLRSAAGVADLVEPACSPGAEPRNQARGQRKRAQLLSPARPGPVAPGGAGSRAKKTLPPPRAVPAHGAAAAVGLIAFALPSPFHQTSCLIFIRRKGTAAMIAARAKPRARRFGALFALTSAQALVLAIPAAVAADDLIVKYDQSQLLRLPRPASEIIIGNPAIADIAIQSGNLLVVTGKSF